MDRRPTLWMLDVLKKSGYSGTGLEINAPRKHHEKPCLFCRRSSKCRTYSRRFHTDTFICLFSTTRGVMRSFFKGFTPVNDCRWSVLFLSDPISFDILALINNTAKLPSHMEDNSESLSAPPPTCQIFFLGGEKKKYSIPRFELLRRPHFSQRRRCVSWSCANEV